MKEKKSELVVQKYGGSSVAGVERIKRVARRVVRVRRRGDPVVVIVSALGDTTDRLVALAGKITENPSRREMDMLLSTGEQVAMSLLAMAVQEEGEEAVSLTGAQVGIWTDAAHSKAKITRIESDRIYRELERGRVVIVAGFQGLNEEREVTTLGRGGSDTSAVAIAAALGADACEIYTDVDGVLSADPRVVKSPEKIDEISYEEMLELANLGARVLHLRAVELAKRYGVTLHVRSSFHGENGTFVKEEEAMEQGQIVTGVAHDFNMAKVTLAGVADRPGIAAEIFQALGAENINVDMIIQSASREGVADISFTIARDDLRQAIETTETVAERLNAEGVYAEKELAKVSIVGAGMVTHPGVAAAMFGSLAEAEINIDMISTSDISISCVVDETRVEEAVQVLHRVFVEEDSTK